MKKTFIVLFVLILGINFSTKAHDFFAVNSDGDTIYYVYTNTNTVGVSFQGNYANSFSNEYHGDIRIPDSVLYNGIYYKVISIGLAAFSDNTLVTSIILPSTLTGIGQTAFSGCSGLSKITIPQNVGNISSGAFQNCTSLDTVYFNATNCISMGSSSNGVFNGCNNLNAIIIGNNVTRIPNYAFYNCSTLTSINIPSSVTTIGINAFNNCTNLITINLPSTITSINFAAFMNCTSLKNINLPSSLISLLNNVFNGCKSLDSVIIPQSVINIGSYIFANCDSLTYVSFPNSINTLSDYAFQNCISLTSLNAPSITSLGTGVFQGCRSLTTYTLPNNLTNIPENIFLDCSSLTSIIIPQSVTRIKSKAFKNCSALNHIDIPNSVSIIDSYAFDSCSSLSIINIPSIISYISNNTFRSCTNLDTIIMNRINPPTIASNAFLNIPDNVTIILPCSSKLKYLNATNWSSFTNFKELSTCQYTINVQSIDTTLGTVTGSGIYPFDTITITATPLQNYSFISWNDGDTNSIRTVIVTKDSTFTAIFKQVVYSNINDTICQGQTYPFYGNNLTVDGFYSHTIPASQTKDSIINLQLKVNPSYSIEIYDTICEGQTYTEYGFNTNISGLNTLNFQTTKGCDSIINLYLYVNQSPTTNIQASICQGHTYSLNGFNADTSGIYALNLQTYKGCDSIVNLSLLVNPTYTIDIQGEVCQGKFYYQNGFFEHMPGIHTRHLQTTEGCDSIINLHLSVNEITTPTNLNLSNIANYIELNWEGDQETYIIYRNNDSLAMTITTTYRDSNVVEGINYCYKIKALEGYCESESSNQECKTFLDLDIITDNSFKATLYPNPTKGRTTLRVEGLNESADVRIYDLKGRLIRTLSINQAKNELEIDVENLAKGVYNIRISNTTTNIIKKLIVN